MYPGCVRDGVAHRRASKVPAVFISSPWHWLSWNVAHPASGHWCDGGGTGAGWWDGAGGDFGAGCFGAGDFGAGWWEGAGGDLGAGPGALVL